MEDRSQLARPKIAELAIDRDPPCSVNRRHFNLVVVIRQDFIIRVLDLEISLVSVELPLTVQDNARASCEDTIEVDLVPPEGPDLILSVGADELVHFQPAALERNDSADANHDLDRCGLAVSQLADARQVRAVFIPHGQVMKQVFDGCLAGIRPCIDCGDLDRQSVRRLLANPRKAMMMQIDQLS